jgi:hypothetical protein
MRKRLAMTSTSFAICTWGDRAYEPPKLRFPRTPIDGKGRDCEQEERKEHHENSSQGSRDKVYLKASDKAEPDHCKKPGDCGERDLEEDRSQPSCGREMMARSEKLTKRPRI